MKDLNGNEIRVIILADGKFILEIEDLDTAEYVAFEVEIEADYTPPEKADLEYPGCDEELVITQVKAPFGLIDLDCISNLEQVQEEMLRARAADVYDTKLETHLENQYKP